MTPRTIAGWALLLMLAGTSFGHAQTGFDLEEGIRAYSERGDVRETIRQIGGALDAETVPSGSRLRAHVYLAHAFLALGDTVSALPHVQAALSIHPCAMPAHDFTPPAWEALYERNRPAGASCGVGWTLIAPLRSALVPGWGQRSLGRGGASRVYLAVGAGSATASLLLSRYADGRYAAYQASTTYPELLDSYDQAERARRVALALGGVAVGVYAWNVFDALLGGIARDREILGVRNVAFTPIVAPGSGARAAFALSIPLGFR